jgi:hypothetical protein
LKLNNAWRFSRFEIIFRFRQKHHRR